MSGIHLADNSNNNTVSGNNVLGNSISFIIENSDNNHIFHNNVVERYQRARIWGECSNVWDNGFPSGGNYWSDYNGADQNKDGIGDTPYIIDENNKDKYPLMASFEISSVTTELPDWEYITISPLISIISPENQEYNETAVPLIFTVNKPAVWLSYSLDGSENVTVTGNTTLTGLSSGLHNVTVYAKDEFDNTGASETISFQMQEPFPAAPVAAASVATVAIVGVGLLVYFKKRRH
jgi:parallel beta-helix repeat protein